MVLNLQQLNNDHKTVEAEIKSKNALTESSGSWEPDRNAV